MDSKKTGYQAEPEGKQDPLKIFRRDDVSASNFGCERQVQGEIRTFYSVTFSRSYKDASDRWRYTKWFDAEDIRKVIAIAQQASDYLQGLKQQTK